MSDYYLGIDIGASSGRHILGHLEASKIELEEIYRFENGFKEINGEKIWDTDALFENICIGLKRCKEIGKIPKTMGIDTWGVDFVLLDKDDNKIGNAVSYRDSRTEGMDSFVYKYISEDDLYKRTGIQKQLFNTIYQLEALKIKNPEALKRAESMLMIPDYFNFLLTGIKKQEFTNATTGQLINPVTKDWDYELIDLLKFPKRIFNEIIAPGSYVGSFSESIKERIGFDCCVIAPATHDTGSAVMAVPGNEENTLFISSGTWSLMGTENKECLSDEKSKKMNFTNEGGYNYTFRFLKNIMGLWMIQSVRNEIGREFSFAEICKRAEEKTINSLVDCNDSRFLAPVSMTEEIKKACAETNQEVPIDLFETARIIYRSLAVCYKNTIEEIKELTAIKYSAINVVGGGSNADYLNRLTAKETGLTVYAGPSEATAIGNILAQLIFDKKVKDLKTARQIVFDSFEIKTYTP